MQSLVISFLEYSEVYSYFAGLITGLFIATLLKAASK